MGGEAIVLNLVDDDFKDEDGKPLPTKDIYVTADINGKLNYNICQG